MTDVLRVFEVRGVYLFRTERDLPAELAACYNPSEGRYEVPTREQLSALSSSATVDVVEDMTDYQVEFPGGQPPDELVDEAILAERDRGTVRLLFPTEPLVERALEAGGVRP